MAFVKKRTLFFLLNLFCLLAFCLCRLLENILYLPTDTDFPCEYTDEFNGKLKVSLFLNLGDI